MQKGTRAFVVSIFVDFKSVPISLELNFAFENLTCFYQNIGVTPRKATKLE